jgi:hypothetical protein
VRLKRIPAFKSHRTRIPPFPVVNAQRPLSPLGLVTLETARQPDRGSPVDVVISLPTLVSALPFDPSKQLSLLGSKFTVDADVCSSNSNHQHPVRPPMLAWE